MALMSAKRTGILTPALTLEITNIFCIILALATASSLEFLLRSAQPCTLLHISKFKARASNPLVCAKTIAWFLCRDLILQYSWRTSLVSCESCLIAFTLMGCRISTTSSARLLSVSSVLVMLSVISGITLEFQMSSISSKRKKFGVRVRWHTHFCCCCVESHGVAGTVL